MDEWQEKKKPVDRGKIMIRLAEIAMEKMVLETEEETLRSKL